MVELHEYDVEVNGLPTTLQLTEEDAKKRGLTEGKREEKAAAPANKAGRAPANKAGA